VTLAVQVASTQTPSPGSYQSAKLNQRLLIARPTTPIKGDHQAENDSSQVVVRIGAAVVSWPTTRCALRWASAARLIAV
jgi:hypothetical protein